jgi:hypothetical protein
MLSRISLLLFFLLIPTSVYATTIYDIKFGQSQIADSQWNVNACLNTTTCQIYAKNPGTAYKIPWTSGKIVWSAGDYIKFTPSDNTAWPYIAYQYSADGTIKATMGQGKIVNMGADFFFFVGTDNNTGQLFSGSSGMVGTAGVTWTGTLNPTVAQANVYADANYSTTPLAAGQTAAPPAPVYSSGITTPQQTRKNSATNLRNSQTGNEIHIEQIGNNNNFTVRQGVSSAGKNRIELYSNGSGNNYNINQGYLTDGNVSANDSNNHYLYLNVTGSNNSITKQQTGTAGFNETTVSGNSNNLTNIQQGSSPKTLFQNINGNSNTVTTNQKDTGQDYLDLKLNGNGHTVNAIQQGPGNHAATIDLTNNGGASTLNMTQQGSTAQTYSIQQSCAAAQGCSATIVQGQ